MSRPGPSVMTAEMLKGGNYIQHFAVTFPRNRSIEAKKAMVVEVPPACEGSSSMLKLDDGRR